MPQVIQPYVTDRGERDGRGAGVNPCQSKVRRRRKDIRHRMTRRIRSSGGVGGRKIQLSIVTDIFQAGMI